MEEENISRATKVFLNGLAYNDICIGDFIKLKIIWDQIPEDEQELLFETAFFNKELNIRYLCMPISKNSEE